MTQRIPKTDSIQELANFWDAHDLTEFEDQLEEVSEPIFAQRTVIPGQTDFERFHGQNHIRTIAKIQAHRECVFRADEETCDYCDN